MPFFSTLTLHIWTTTPPTQFGNPLHPILHELSQWFPQPYSPQMGKNDKKQPENWNGMEVKMNHFVSYPPSHLIVMHGTKNMLDATSAATEAISRKTVLMDLIVWLLLHRNTWLLGPRHHKHRHQKGIRSYAHITAGPGTIQWHCNAPEVLKKLDLRPGPFVATMDVMMMLASPNRAELSFLVSVVWSSRRTVAPGRSQIEHGSESPRWHAKGTLARNRLVVVSWFCGMRGACGCA